jgi:hypothetical protein
MKKSVTRGIRYTTCRPMEHGLRKVASAPRHVQIQLEYEFATPMFSFQKKYIYNNKLLKTQNTSKNTKIVLTFLSH